MNKDIRNFAELYTSIKNLPENDTFLNHIEAGQWRTYSKTEFLSTVRYLTLAFDAEGWRGKQIGLAISPSVYWLLIDYALMLSGAVSVPLFTNISTKNLKFQVGDADLHTVFIQTREQEKIILDVDPTIRCIEIRCIDFNTTAPQCDSLDIFIQTGQKIDHEFPSRFSEILAEVNPDEVVTIVYTSGSSGLPKGVELTHFNLISQIIDTGIKYQFDPLTDKALSLLPLAHIFERMVMHFYLSTGMSIYFSDNVKNLGKLMHSVQPTVMTVVPRLLEKVCFKMHTKAMASGTLKKIIARPAFWRSHHKDPDSQKNWIDTLLDKLVYSKLRASLGGNLRMMISGGAPLVDELYRFFLNIGIPLYQGYGLTEASPVICANAPGENKVGTCGKPFAHTQVVIDRHGELLARGASIMKGYHNNQRATDEVLDSEGWLRTGDLATMDSDGYITITGRSKELAKTSTGEYISTPYIEHLLMASGWFDHVLVVGNNRPFVVALLMIDKTAVEEFTARQAIPHVENGVHSERFIKEIKQLIKKINRKLNQWERIRNFRLITETLSIENGDLTPSMKLARNHVLARFHAEIEKMYQGHI